MLNLTELCGFGVSGDGPTTHWRLAYGPSTDAYYYIQAIEIELRGAVGGADLCSGGTASASSTYSAYGSSYGPALAFDNSTTPPGWISNSFGAGWIAYTFPAPVDIKQVMWMTDQQAGGDFTYLTLQRSFDGGTTWEDVAYWGGLTWYPSEQKILTV